MGALFNRYDLDRSKYLSIEDFGRMLFKLDGDPYFGEKHRAMSGHGVDQWTFSYVI